MNELALYSTAFFLTVLFIYILKKTAVAFHLVDRPSERKQHRGEVPLIGGIAMYIAIVACSFFVQRPPYAFEILLECLFVLVLFGALDDKLNLSARTRLMIHVLTVLAMSNIAHLYLSNLGDLLGFGAIRLPHYLAVTFTIFCVVGVINAFNMIDGVDGLAGGVALVGLLSFSGISFASALNRRGTVLLLIASIVAGFLAFNMRHPWRKKAAIFMGDAGSTMLGFILAWFAVDFSQGNHTWEPHSTIYPITAVWILAIPIIDTIAVILDRMIVGKSPFAAGRDHLHHILMKKGYRESTIVLIIVALSAITSLFGIIGWYFRIPESSLFYCLLGLFTIYLYVRHAYSDKADLPGTTAPLDTREELT